VSERTRLLGIDHGKVRLGLAVSDPERRIASPYDNYTRRSLEQDAAYLKKVIEAEDIGTLIIGLPVHLSGREGEQALAARAFGRWLAQLTGLDCVFWDERFSTWEAENSLGEAGFTRKKRKARRDQVAAQILLQAYIDADCPA
jgi:putative Holliday junction resolvase